MDILKMRKFIQRVDNMRLIGADDLLVRWRQEAPATYSLCKNIIDEAPTIGEWRRAKYDDKFECSNCLHVFDADVRYKYCPHYGIKMRW